jgi:hypothetical protein
MAMNKSRDPLFYIIQPTISYPKVNMQESFVMKKPEAEQSVLQDVNEKKEDKEKKETETEKNEKEVTENEKLDQKKKVSLEKENLTPDDIQELIHQYHEENKKEETSVFKGSKKHHFYTFNRVKSFKEMNILERLHYIEHFPKQLPPVPCVFVTKSQSVKGFLLNKTDDVIEIKQMNQKVAEIQIDDLVEVKMIGL